MTGDVASKIEAFFGNYRLKKYTKGQVLILNDEKTDFIYYIVSGKVKQYDISNRGDEMILNVFKPPAFFPMSLAISKQPSPHIFEAETDIEVRQVPADEAVEFIKNNPDVMFDLLTRLYRGVDGVLGRMAQLMTSSAHSRLIYELVLESRRFGKERPNGSVSLTINEKDLGARAGLTRETVSREIGKLKADKLINTKSKTIVIKDVSALEDLLRNQ